MNDNQRQFIAPVNTFHAGLYAVERCVRGRFETSGFGTWDTERTLRAAS